jgi:deoxyribodipyrimidine photo-lyase
MSALRGGRRAAEAVLAAVKPQSYERTRNYLSGDVTRLSAYLRHGVLTLAEVRDDALHRVADPREAGKLINEYAWRDYWLRLYDQLLSGGRLCRSAIGRDP